MYFLKKSILFAITIFIFSNCTGDGTASVETAAKDICTCTESLLTLNQKMEALKQNGKIEELTQLMEEAGKELNAATKCAEKNIPENTDKEKLKKALEKTCQMDQRLAEDLLKTLSSN